MPMKTEKKNSKNSDIDDNRRQRRCQWRHVSAWFLALSFGKLAGVLAVSEMHARAHVQAHVTSIVANVADAEGINIANRGRGTSARPILKE